MVSNIYIYTFHNACHFIPNVWKRILHRLHKSANDISWKSAPLANLREFKNARPSKIPNIFLWHHPFYKKIQKEIAQREMDIKENYIKEHSNEKKKKIYSLQQ